MPARIATAVPPAKNCRIGRAASSWGGRFATTARGGSGRALGVCLLPLAQTGGPQDTCPHGRLLLVGGCGLNTSERRSLRRLGKWRCGRVKGPSAACQAERRHGRNRDRCGENVACSSDNYGADAMARPPESRRIIDGEPFKLGARFPMPRFRSEARIERNSRKFLQGPREYRLLLDSSRPAMDEPPRGPGRCRLAGARCGG